MSNKIILDNFKDLLEVVALQNFDEITLVSPEPDKSVFKKAVKIGNGFKKAVLISKAPFKPTGNGGRFTLPKTRNHGKMIHFTNPKNAFKRALRLKSRKGAKHNG